ncbi:hypothetical protein APHAL10511_003159 [Amanita phalloides]|nr:hypothetical protein APHAL10511_003159 [Amanita phalloides]
MYKNDDDRKNIVIIGAGAGGAATARTLSAKLDSRKYNLILINPRPFLLALPPTVRASVSNVDNLQDRIFPPLDKIFHNGNGTFVQGKVHSIDKKHGKKGGSVLLENGQRIPFEILVLSPGSSWTGPIAFPDDAGEMQEFIKNGRIAFDKAQSIVIAGGGAVGIELAGEIKDIWPHKKVTIVQGDSGLLNAAYPDKFRERVESRTRAYGVDIILNDYIDTFEVGHITAGTGIRTRKGREVQADLAVSARGPTPNTSFIVTSLGAHVANERGYVKTRPTFQLPDYPEIFALGDIIDWKEQKQLTKAQAHAAIVAANVDAYLSGRTLTSYKGSPEMIVITLGKHAGVSYVGMMWGIVMGDWFTRTVKSKGLFIDNLRKSVGY